MASLMETLYDVGAHFAKTKISQSAAPAGPPMVPSFQPPVMPTFQAPTMTMPTAPVFLAPVAAPATAVGSAPGASPGSYSATVADGVACLSCTRRHLASMMTAAQAAQEAMAEGDDDAAALHWARVAAEIDIMEAIDWAPEKLAASPAADQAIIAAVRPCVEQLRRQIPTPRDAAMALGSAQENKRFASSRNFTARDQAEIELRLQLLDAHGGAMENTTADDAARTALREARHTIDAAQDHGTLYDPETYTAVEAELEVAASRLTPVGDARAAESVATQCQTCQKTFYTAWTEAMRQRGRSPS